MWSPQSGRAPIQTQASFHFAHRPHSMLLNPPRSGTLSYAPGSQVAPDGQDTHSAPSPAGLLSLPAVWPQSASCPAPHIEQSPCCPPCGGGWCLPCAQTLLVWLGAGSQSSGNLAPLRVGRKVDSFQVVFLQVHIIKMVFLTLKSGSFFQVQWWSAKHQGTLNEELLEVT